MKRRRWGLARADVLRETWMALSKTRSRKRLAIIVAESGLLTAELLENASGTTLSRAARFACVTGNALEQLPAAAGAFADFLKQQGFSSRRVIFGLPARHLMLLRHELPAADEQTTASALWLHASTQLPPELGKTAFDFLSDTPEPHLQQVTIVGLQQPLSERLREFCKTAGLEADCAMPTLFALAHATGRLNGNALILQRQESTAELLVQVNHLPRLLRSVTTGAAGALQSELRRAAAQLPASDLASGTAKTFVVWDCATRNPVPDDLLAAAAGIPPTRPDSTAMGLTQYGVSPDSNLILAALVDAALATDRPAINFFKPRIIEPRATSAVRGRSLMMVSAVVLLVILGLAWFDLQHLSADARRTQAQLDALQPEVRNAKPLIQRLEYLNAFTAARPRYLACLRDLTEGVEAISSVHLDHFDLNQAMQGNCSGQAAVEKDALDFVDRLNSSKRFSKVNCKLDTDTSPSEGEKVTFRIAFGYLPID